MSKYIVLFLFACLIAGCTTKKDISESYQREMAVWKAKRLDAVVGAEGWATLIGLHWFEEGESRIGSDSSNTIIMAGAPPYLGSFFVQGEEIIFKSAADSMVTVSDSLINQLVIDIENSPVFEWQSYSWFVISRSGQFALRMRNTKSPEMINFKGLNYFPLDPEAVVKASFELHDPPRIKTIETVLNTTVEYPNPATLHFEYKGNEYSLEALDEGGDEYFIIFTDETSATETYGAGRYMYISKTPVDGFLTLDFNKSYNPPCAFTPYATCPIPPPENQLKVAIRAGELDYH